MLIRNRLHNASYSKTIKIIINKNQNSKCNSHNLCTGSCFNFLLCIMSECSGSSRLVHQCDNCTENNKENQNTDIIAVRQNAYKAIIKNMSNRSFKRKSGIQQTSDQNTHEQGTVHLFGDEGKCYRYNWRHQSPESCIKIHFNDSFRIKSTTNCIMVYNV